MPKREADIWDWSKTITTVQEKLIIALAINLNLFLYMNFLKIDVAAIQYEMYVLDPVIGGSTKEDLTYN